jgi:hypothetical protein
MAIAPVDTATMANSPRGGGSPDTAAMTPPPALPANRGVDITVGPRVMITFASGLVNRVFGEGPSARDNAWQAVLADRERAAQRAELSDVLRSAVPSGARNTRRPAARPRA